MNASSLIGEQKSLLNQLKQLEGQLEGLSHSTNDIFGFPLTQLLRTEKNTALKQLEAVDRPLPELIEEAETRIQGIKK